ncbi:DUF7268 family protein [Haladaptatus salinisoli]|uniref:DUF7268 family protein n=1 Tax=Haladaptatus salinisoli TaxID=2884876 RepID=UPI001D0B5EE6|nr:hypothetical protein [Haladaptatus salinisoli]
MIPSGYLRPRVRLVWRFGRYGIVLGGAGVLLAVAAGESLAFASRKAFAVSTLAFGFALLGWSGSVFAGRTVENAQEYLDTNSNWTEADSRRAMTVVGSLGAGGMVGASAMTLVLRASY